MTRTTLFTNTLAVGAALLCASSAMAATLNYDFGTDPGKTTVAGAGFTTITEATTGVPPWSSQVNDVANAARITGSGEGSASFTNAGFVQMFTGLGGSATNDFTITTTFTLSDYLLSNANNDRIGGIQLFADTADSAGINGSGISITPIGASGTDNDRLVIRRGLSGTDLVTGKVLGYDFANGDQFLLQVVGSFSGTTLNLNVSLSRNGGAAQELGATLDTVTDATVLDGTFSGISQRFKRTTSTDYDTLSVTVVPEPASVALLGLGALAVLGRRRGS